MSFSKIKYVLWLLNGIETTNNECKYLQKEMTIFKSTCSKLEHQKNIFFTVLVKDHVITPFFFLKHLIELLNQVFLVLS